MINIESFDEGHEKAYQSELDRHPVATERLFALLNDRDNGLRMVHMSEADLPALRGIVKFIEGDPDIAPVIAPRKPGWRYRQAIGVAIKLRMQELGWGTTGRKGSLGTSRYFKTSEIYAR
jgi:hypothetical protein